MLGFLSEYWLLILVCAIFIAAVVILARKGYKKEARAIALSLVAAARILLDEKTISSIIEEAVKKLKKYLSSESGKAPQT